jgi:DNA-binding NarL/FixJ family response regulator
VRNLHELGVGRFGGGVPASGRALRLVSGGSDDRAHIDAGANLRQRAEQAILSPDGTEPLSELWQALVTGQKRAVDSFIDDVDCFIVVRDAQPGERLPPLANARNRALLTRVLLGEPQKRIAFDLRVSTSSVAAIAAQYTRAMGFETGVSRLPVLLLMAAHAAARGLTDAVAQSARFVHEGSAYRIFGAARPNPARCAALSVAECAVVSLLFERRNNADIARLRRRSPCTVANQLGRVMHKVGARGRYEIISRVIEYASAP